MRTPSVTPIDVPSDFLIDEMFFSTTDRKGIIQSGNAVFARVSGYTMGELVGQPHNIIRHPDMPRVVFRLLWDFLQRDLPVVALVKNMSKEGHYYWVIALITPVPGGFLSVRFKPSSPVSTRLKEIYRHLRAVEAENGNGGDGGRAGMDAAEKVLGEALQRLGFADYAGFMWKLLHDEMKSRDALVRGTGMNQAGRTAVGASGTIAVLHSICEDAAQAYVQINSLYEKLDELTSLHDGLAGKSAVVLDLTHSIRFVALSTAVKAAQLGEDGRSLGVIAQFLNDASAHTSAEVQRLTASFKAVTAELHAVIFNLASARLQLEMMMFFGRELLQAEAGATARAETAGVSRQKMIEGLQKAFHVTMVRAVNFLTSLGQQVRTLKEVADDLRRTVLTLHVAQVGGKIEASRLRNDDSIAAILVEIHTHIAKTDGELNGLAETTGHFSTLIQAVPAIARVIYQLLANIERDVGKLSFEHPDQDARSERIDLNAVALSAGHAGNAA